MVTFIARSKLVPDFGLTIHFLHLLLVSLYTGQLPRHAMWWFTMLLSAALSIALGMWGCRYRELQPVFFGGGRILGASTSGGTGQVSTEEGEAQEEVEGDEEMGFSRGRGRGRGRDGAGEYEMVKIETPR